MRVSLSFLFNAVVLALFLMLGGAWPASASTKADPRRVMFTPSPDDDSVDANGVPLLDRYSLLIFVAGGDAPIQSANLGKPSPDPDGEIRVDFVSLLLSPLTPGIAYEAVVEAVGPFGSTESERSDPFSFSAAPCDPWISPVTMTFSAAGGSSISSVNAAAGCAWTAASNESWITVTAGATGAGNGPVTFAVAPQTEKNTRNGTLTIAGRNFRVHQSGAPKEHKSGPGRLVIEKPTAPKKDAVVKKAPVTKKALVAKKAPAPKNDKDSKKAKH